MKKVELKEKFPSPFRASFLLIKVFLDNNSDYNKCFRLLSEHRFFLLTIIVYEIKSYRNVSVSFQSIVSSYPPSTNPLFYHILFYHFRENSKNLYISLP